MNFKNYLDLLNRVLSPSRTSTTDSCDNLDGINVGILRILSEHYRSLRLAYSSSAATSNRMIQFLAVACAGFAAFGINSLLTNTQAGIWISVALFLAGLPGTIAIIYLAWVREFLPKARASLLLLRLELRISRLVERLALEMYDIRERKAPFLRELHQEFGGRFLDSEIWMRKENPAGKNLIDTKPYIAISFIFLIVGLASLNLGAFLAICSFERACLSNGETPLQFIAQRLENTSLAAFIFYIPAIELSQFNCDGAVPPILLDIVRYGYWSFLVLGLSVGVYTSHLLFAVKRITRSLLNDYYR